MGVGMNAQGVSFKWLPEVEDIVCTWSQHIIAACHGPPTESENCLYPPHR